MDTLCSDGAQGLLRAAFAGRALEPGPAPPWHYVGDMLVVEYWADPSAAAAVLPAPLEPHPDGGRAAAMFIDWQSCCDDGDELIDPVALAVQGVLRHRQRAL